MLTHPFVGYVSATMSDNNLFGIYQCINHSFNIQPPYLAPIHRMLGFLPEVDDVTVLPTVDGDPAFSRDLANKTVTVRLYVGDPLLGVIPPAAHLRASAY